MAYFTQHIGAVLRDLGNFLNSRDYIEARLLAAQVKLRAEYEKTIQPDFRTSDYFAKAHNLFNSFLDECVNFTEFLRVTTIQKETGCDELLDNPEQIQNSIERLNLLKKCSLMNFAFRVGVNTNVINFKRSCNVSYNVLKIVYHTL